MPQTTPLAANNRFPYKFNPAGFQWMYAGKVIALDAMSRDDLLQATCETIVALERMEELQRGLAKVVQDWRAMRIILDEDEAGDAGLEPVPARTQSAPPAEGNQLPRKFNPAGFRWMFEDKALPLDTMSREDLLQLFCETMVALERMEELQLSLAQMAEDWRQGRITLDKEDGGAAG